MAALPPSAPSSLKNGCPQPDRDKDGIPDSDDACPDGANVAFLDGTAPTDTCDHPPDKRNLFQKIFGLGKPGN